MRAVANDCNVLVLSDKVDIVICLTYWSNDSIQLVRHRCVYVSAPTPLSIRGVRESVDHTRLMG